MPIGLVSNEEFERELGSRQSESIDTHEKSELTEDKTRGRKEGDVNVPESLRKIIGEESVINGRSAALSIARDFGISDSSVSAYAKGATSTTTYDSPVQSLINHINKSRQRAIKKASTTLNKALGSITQDKLDYADAKDLSAIAKDMSVIIKNLEPKEEVNNDASAQARAPQFVIFAPQFRKEESFEVIDVKEG
jgi:predicted transcriptional regulator